MTAAVAGAAAGEGAAVVGAGEGAGTAAARAPSASAPVGTAGGGAGSSGAKPRTQNQLRGPRSSTSRSSASSSSSRSSASSGKKSGKKGGGRTAILPSGGRGKGPHLNLKGRGRKLLLAEFILCAVIIALSPLTDKHKTDSPATLMKRNTAIAALFLLLALLSTAGKGASRVAAAFGGLVTIALLVSDRDVLVKVAERFRAPANSAGPAGPPGAGAAPPAPEAPAEGPAEPVPAPPGPRDPGLGIPAPPGGLPFPWFPPLVFGPNDPGGFSPIGLGPGP